MKMMPYDKRVDQKQMDHSPSATFVRNESRLQQFDDAETHYRVLTESEHSGVALVEVQPITGIGGVASSLLLIF